MKIIPDNSVIKDNFTNTTVGVQNYYQDVLKGDGELRLKPCSCDKNLKRDVRDTMETMVKFGFGEKDDITDVDYDTLMSDLGNMNGILNDVLIMICTGDDKVGDLLHKYVDSEGKRCFTDDECKYFNNRSYDANRELFRGVLGVHERLNHLMAKKKEDGLLIGGGLVLNQGYHKIMIDYSSLHNNEYNLYGGKGQTSCGCECHNKSKIIKRPSTSFGKISEQEFGWPISNLLNYNRLFGISSARKKGCKCCGHVPNEGKNEGKNDDGEEGTNDGEEGTNDGEEGTNDVDDIPTGGGNPSDDKNTSDSDDKTESSSNEKPKDLNSYLNSGDLNDLMNVEDNLSDEMKTQFDWVHWKFYRLWTLEKLHPILKMPFDMVDPMLRSFGMLVKKIVTPFLSKLSTPGITFLWQTLGTVINASAMIPIVGVATGAIGAIHAQLTTPIMILAGEI